MDNSQEVYLEKLVATLLSNSGITGVAFSELAMRLLAEAARLLRYKTSERDQLSSTTYTLAVYFYVQNIRGEASAEESALQYAIKDAGLSSSALEQISRTFFTSIPNVPGEPSDYPTSDDLQDVKLGVGTRAVIARWRDREPIRADVLLRMLLDDRETGIFGRLKGRFENAQEHADKPSRSPEAPKASTGSGSEDAPPPVRPGREPLSGEAPPPGRHVKIVREATLDELGLNALDYAKALATILRVSEGEFNFALFGKWGSGKTTLLRLLKPLLEDPAEYRRNVSVPKSEGYADREYKVVVHNAWKYRRPPEAWIFLYKSLASVVANSANPLERWAIALRSNIGRRGRGGPLISLALLAVALAPMGAKLQLAGLIVSVLGVSAAFYLVMISMSAPKKVKRLFEQNLRLVGPEENLGMLALIGDDVRALLKAWTREPSAAKRRREYPIWPVAGLAIVSALWAISLYLGSVFEPPALVKDLLGRMGLLESGPQAVDLTHWLIWGLWTLSGLALLLLPYVVNSQRPDRILLVIDDLDRCEASEMLSVIENVRLLLDDEQINSRMQVLMLVDESVLTHAVVLRYGTMIAERSSSPDYEGSNDPSNAAASEIVAEQIEKLFACHLRLSRLSDDDVVQLVQKLAGQENDQIRKAKAEADRAARDVTRRAAKEQLDKAIAEEELARRRHKEVASGQPLPMGDPDGPAERQPPMPTKIRMGVEYVPKIGAERRRIEEQNRRTEERNRETDRMTEQKRLSRNPEVVRGLETARARSAELRGIYENIPPETETAIAKASDAPFEANDVRFSDAEIAFLSGFMPSYFRTIRRRPSPRSIKALLFKLQLARLLIQMRHPDLPAQELQVEKLMRAFQVEALGTSSDSGPHAQIVRQVI